MKIKYQIDTQKKIISETWPGEVSIEDYIEVKQNQFKDPDFNPDFHVITDLRNNKQRFNEDIIMGIKDIMKSQSKYIRNRKSAIIANKPQAVASSIFLQLKSHDVPVEIKVFSTIESTYAWLEY